MFILKSLPAYDGDCFLISFGTSNNVKNIIVDGGRKKVAVNKLKNEILQIKDRGEVIDLLILTHIDNDHIYGLLKLFETDWIDKTIIKEIWYNSKKNIGNELFHEKVEDDLIINSPRKNSDISYKQGITFSKRLEELGFNNNKLIISGETKTIGEGKILVLSPDEENLKKLYLSWDKAFPAKIKDGVEISSNQRSDYSKSIEELLTNKLTEDRALANGSSIAFLLFYEDKKILMLADSHPSIITKNIKKYLKLNSKENIWVDLIKLSHHGSIKNINNDFIKSIDSDKYLISTNGFTHNLPNKETLVRIASNRRRKTTFLSNYSNVLTNAISTEEKKRLDIIFKETKNNEILEIEICKCLESSE